MKQQRKSIQALQAKIRQYKRNYGVLHGTPVDNLPKKCCQTRRWAAWQKTYEMYFAKYGNIGGREWRKKKEWLDVLDSLLTKAVRIKNPECVVCGKIPKKLKDSQASHLLPKSRYPGLRYELDNVVHMCNDCHMNFWHKNPIEANIWLQEKYPDIIGLLLDKRANKAYNTQDFVEKQIYFQKILENT